MPELKSTLRVFNEADLKDRGSIAKGQSAKVLVGNAERPDERLRLLLASMEVGTHVPLHWHAVEKLYYVISGRAVLTDIEGNTCEIKAGSVIYVSPGIASSHGWDVKEKLQLVGIYATTDPLKGMQFKVDPSNKTTFVEFETLIKEGGGMFKSFY